MLFFNAANDVDTAENKYSPHKTDSSSVRITYHIFCCIQGVGYILASVSFIC
jgi:hypothetical protein